MTHVAKKCFKMLYRGTSHVGERFGIEWLTYNYGVFLSFHRTAVLNAPKFVEAVLAEFPNIKSLCDVGCGTGEYAAGFQRRGLRVKGCEYAPLARRWAAKQGVNVTPFQLADPSRQMPGTPYDLAMSIEVAEHVPAALADAMVDYLSRCSDQIVFTAAHPGQVGGTGHINEQPQSYWIEKFIARGMRHDSEATRRLGDRLRAVAAAEFLYENLMVFKR